MNSNEMISERARLTLSDAFSTYPPLLAKRAQGSVSAGYYTPNIRRIPGAETLPVTIQARSSDLRPLPRKSVKLSWVYCSSVTSLPAVRIAPRIERHHQYFDLERVLLPPHLFDRYAVNVIVCR
ncbi:hypothetical protein BU25DRAFT_412555 [Macroventuria anomochaeta]|uniref:Uncharacterized protein n=1 Tax=Macroventuria anomochaeta TaxID=301207 RepID=A0ACB6RUF0_9PLEO|nr:uncharacterized protein BU25DRAFT_412555 [Macroventuria anomochaeta]KAF2625516.1 hypothetical protein BU25DRAFT_412555 [Macroventuria anomochaeta]